MSAWQGPPPPLVSHRIIVELRGGPKDGLTIHRDVPAPVGMQPIVEPLWCERIEDTSYVYILAAIKHFDDKPDVAIFVYQEAGDLS